MRDAQIPLLHFKFSRGPRRRAASGRKMEEAFAEPPSSSSSPHTDPILSARSPALWARRTLHALMSHPAVSQSGASDEEKNKEQGAFVFLLFF